MSIANFIAAFFLKSILSLPQLAYRAFDISCRSSSFFKVELSQFIPKARTQRGMINSSSSLPFCFVLRCNEIIGKQFVTNAIQIGNKIKWHIDPEIAREQQVSIYAFPIRLNWWWNEMQSRRKGTKYWLCTYTYTHHRSLNRHVSSHARHRIGMAMVADAIVLLLQSNHANSTTKADWRQQNPWDRQRCTAFVSIINRTRVLKAAILNFGDRDPIALWSFSQPLLPMVWKYFNFQDSMKKCHCSRRPIWCTYIPLSMRSLIPFWTASKR